MATPVITAGTELSDQLQPMSAKAVISAPTIPKIVKSSETTDLGIWGRSQRIKACSN